MPAKKTASKAKKTTKASKKMSTREKVKQHRARLRAQGLRPIQIWAPDTRSPEFAAEARRQSKLVAESARESQDQAFVDAISDRDWE
ncbi:MAG: hypothetical protein Kow00133_15070 [Amphiplicatus sp.]